MTNPVSAIPQIQPPYRPVLNRFQLQAEQARQRFQRFVEQAWHVLEPQTPFVSGIHIDAICEHLQAVTEGRIKNLIINVPPGHAKSLLTTVFWPAWYGLPTRKPDGCSAAIARIWRCATASNAAA